MKRIYPSVIFLGALALLACSAEPKTVGGAIRNQRETDANPKFDAAKEVKLAQSELEDLQVQRHDTKQRLAVLRVVNDKLCKRLVDYRKDCFASARLYETPNDKVLGCADNYEDGTKFAPTFEVSAAAPAGKGPFYLRADNSFDTGDFENGTDQKLAWGATTKDRTLPPRLWELTSVRLKALNGATLPAPADMNFEVAVNGNVIFNKDSIIPVADASGTYELKLDTILEAKGSDVCSVSDDELAALVEEAKAEAAQGGAVVEEDNLGKLPPESSLNDRVLLDALKKAIDEVKGGLGESMAKASREEDRNGKLNKELTADRSVGCFAKQTIDVMEIKINGAHLPIASAVIDNKKREEEGNPRQLFFRFAEGMTHTHADEEQQSVIVPGGTIMIRNFGSQRIADIEYIALEKGGTGWEAVDTSWGWPKKHIEWKNSEKFRYRIDSMQIKINGEEFYFADGINHTLQSGTLKWSDLNITANPAYRKLMRRTDCPVK